MFIVLVTAALILLLLGASIVVAYAQFATLRQTAPAEAKFFDRWVKVRHSEMTFANWSVVMVDAEGIRIEIHRFLYRYWPSDVSSWRIPATQIRTVSCDRNRGRGGEILVQTERREYRLSPRNLSEFAALRTAILDLTSPS